MPPGARTTGRLRAAVGAAIGDAARSVAEVAASFAVSWPTAHAAFVEHADALLTTPQPTSVLGIDGTRRGKPRRVREDDLDGVAGNRAVSRLGTWLTRVGLRTSLTQGGLGCTGASRDVIVARLYVFYAWCASTTIDELHTLAGTVETWRPEIEAFIDTGITNAKTEGLNRLVKQVKRSGCGSATSPTSTAEYGSTAPAPRAATTTSRSLPG